MWEHNGVCHCGRRTYLLSQCLRCLKEELLERQEEELNRQDEASLEPKEQSKEFVELPGEQESRAGGGHSLSTLAMPTDCKAPSDSPAFEGFAVITALCVERLVFNGVTGKKNWTESRGVAGRVQRWKCLDDLRVLENGERPPF